MTQALPLFGHQTAQARFLAARASGRLHHGWILQGPSGIGKARLAKRIAALMLGAESMDAPEVDPVMQKIVSGSHPDLKYVARGLNDKGQLKQDISVDQVRELNKFFALRPALAGWRVGILDSLDESNLSGLNAILKTLEEPPENALLLLISHGAKPVLPTIRSRCQILRLGPLEADDTKAVLEHAGVDDKRAVSLASGRPGYGIELLETGGGAALLAARTLLKSIDKPSPSAVAEALQAASRDAGSLAAYTDALLAWVAEQADARPALGKTWMDMHHIRATATEMNMTSLQTASKLLTVLQEGLKAQAATA